MAELTERPLYIPLPAEADWEGDSPETTVELGTCLVTGSSGFLGSHLVRELIRRGHRVRAFDSTPISFTHERLEVVEGDVTVAEEIHKACVAVDTVFHTLAVRDSHRFPNPQARERSFAVNVEGVRNVLEASARCGVARLVHTSSNQVTFDGPVIDGDESTPYVARMRDLDTETMIYGEQITLAVNGDRGLLTCVIRPGLLYGPGDPDFLPRVVEMCASGKWIAMLGDGREKSDYVYVGNLVDAQIEAARHLVVGSPLPGQVYCINDGAPINFFEFTRPWIEDIGFQYPQRRIPARYGEALCAAWEFLHRFAHFSKPPMTWLEVRKITVNHHTRTDRARRDFGWAPEVGASEAAESCLEYCRQLLIDRETVDRPSAGWWVAIVGAMTLLTTLTLSPDAYRAWSETVTSWTPHWLLASVWVFALGVHIRRGMKAVRMAERAGFQDTSLGWGWQTFALGSASLSLLQQRVRRRASDDRAPQH